LATLGTTLAENVAERLLGAISQIVASDARTLGIGAAHHMAALARAIGGESFEAGSAGRSGLFFDRRHGAVLCVCIQGDDCSAAK
jgi:hypothetical protein